MNYFSDADKLRAKFDGRVAGYLYTNYPIKKISWFRVGGSAELLFKPKDLTDLKKFMHLKPSNVPVTILGGASNTLIRDNGIPGVVIVLDRALGSIFLIVPSPGPTPNHPPLIMALYAVSI